MSSKPGYLSGRARIGEPDSQFRDALFETLANGVRREVVSVLLDERESISVRELAGRVAERTFGDPDAAERKRVHVSLVHTHLPRLEAAEFATYDPEAETVRASGELARYRCTVETVLSAAADRPAESVDEELKALATRRQRVVLALLDAASSLSFDELATRVAERELAADATEGDSECEAVRLSLYHAHLPKLDACGFVRCNSETNAIERGENGFVDRLGGAALPDVER